MGTTQSIVQFLQEFRRCFVVSYLDELDSDLLHLRISFHDLTLCNSPHLSKREISTVKPACQRNNGILWFVG